MKNAVETGPQTVETNSNDTSDEAIKMNEDIVVFQPIMPAPKCSTEVPQENDLTAVHPLPLGPVFASGEGEDITAVQPIMPSPMCGTEVPKGDDLTAVHPLPLGPVFVSDQGEDITAVQPIMPPPSCGTEAPEGNDLTAVQPLPLGPVFASSEGEDITAVQPLPLGPVFADGEGEDIVAVQPIMPTPKSGTDVREDNDLTAVHPLPLGPVPATDNGNELTAVQPLPLGPVFADGEGDDIVAVQPIMPASKSGTDVPEDNDLTAVHPLPLGPVPATDNGNDLTTVQPVMPYTVPANDDGSDLIVVQPIMPGAVPASTEIGSVMLSSTAMSSSESFYSDSQWAKLESLGLDTLAGYALDGGPTVSGRWGDGDFTAIAKEKLLVGTSWHQTGLAYYDKMELRSAGLLVTDADQLTIDAENLIDPVYSNGGKNGWHHLKTHYLYTAIDASNAEDYVTYQGVTKNHWQGSTSATGKSYDFHNIFKGGDFGNDITGGNYGDTLIGGEGNDTIRGVGGENIIYGVGGDNRIDGGSGSSTIFGGTGDDFIVTGKGSNTVVLGNGNNWVVVDQNNLDGTTSPNKIMLGSGTDTVVIGNIPPSETTVTSSMSDWQMGLVSDTTIDTTSNFFGWAIEELGATNPLWGMMLTAGTDLISALVGGTPSQVVETTDYPVFEATEVYDFNPLTDRLLLPMNAEGSTNLAVKVEADGHDLTIYDYNSNTVLAYVDFASAAEIFGTSGSLSSVEKKAFGEALLSSVLIMDSDGLTVGSGDATNDFSVDASDIASIGSFSDDIGAGRYMFLGAWNGNHMFGDSSYKTYMGTQHNDVLFSFDVTGDSINAATGGGAKFYGFSGNNLFATGTGHNLVFGGTGEDTVTYQYAFGAINADMTVLSIDPDNPSHGAHFTVTQDLEGFHEDYLWNVQNLIGSTFGDTIVGNYEDNTLVSTGGDNTWTGTGGSNTFVLNGGSAHIIDFKTGSDTIVIDELSYVDETSNVDYGASLTWIKGDNDWTLYDQYNGMTLAILDKNQYLDQASEITLIIDDGTEWVYTPETSTYSDLGVDLVA